MRKHDQPAISMVATDVAVRGLDVNKFVINYNYPSDETTSTG